MDLLIRSATIFLRPLTGTLSSFGLRTGRTRRRRLPSADAALRRSLSHVFLGDPSHRARPTHLRDVDSHLAGELSCRGRRQNTLRALGVRCCGLGDWTCWLTVDAGVDETLAAFWSEGCPLPSESITKIVCPTFTTSPSFARIFDTLPVLGDGISTFTLSVITSTRGCSSLTLSPSFTSHFRISPSAMPSPMSGNLRSISLTFGGSMGA